MVAPPTVNPRVAVCHEWITTFSGSEQVAAAIAEALDAARVFTFTGERELITTLFGDRPVETVGRLGRSRLAQRHWQWFLPQMPRSWRSLDLSGFDVVVTSSHATVNSIRVPDGVHISYCHTPMRYAWEWEQELDRFPLPLAKLWPFIASSLRRQDLERSHNVDLFIANSHNVAARIRRYYARDAEVVYPPIDTTYWTPDPRHEKESFFLVAGRLVAYKKPQLAVEAAREAGVPLVIAGAGPLREKLGAMTSSDVRFVDSPGRETLRDLYRSARALVFPGEEDFGMTMVEAQACGTPVVALDRGGAREAVVDGKTGELYADPSDLAGRLHGFDDRSYEAKALREHADRFGAYRFADEIRSIVGGAGRD